MARKAKTINQKVADALDAAKKAANGGHVFRAKSIPRAQGELLKAGGWLLDIHGGWYALIAPGGKDGDTVPFFSNYWEFVRKYLEDRVGRDYALSAVASMALHSDSFAIPLQLAIHTTRTTQGIVSLPFSLSLAIYTDSALDLLGVVEKDGIRILSQERALAAAPAVAYRFPSPELVATVSTVRNIPELSRILLSCQALQAASRLVDAFRGVGRDAAAELIEKAFASAGIPVKATHGLMLGAFETDAAGATSAISARLRATWRSMRSQLSAAGVTVPAPKNFRELTFSIIRDRINEVYVQDAYNSLSIEGYQVTEDLIRRVATGEYDPNNNAQDQKLADTLVARGYFEAFGSVVETLQEIHDGGNVTETLERAYLDWRAKLFSPAVKAGILPLDSLAGYRRESVYISGSAHVPPAHEKLMDAMDTLFACMRSEQDPWICAVLTHFMFVNIHPFPDGNGRIGRFLMNSVLVAGGYEWTILRVSERPRYFDALEKASIDGDIIPLANFIAGEMVGSGNSGYEPVPREQDPSNSRQNELAHSTTSLNRSLPMNTRVVSGPGLDCAPPGCSTGPNKPRKCERHQK
jgi:hypothetical protein